MSGPARVAPAVEPEAYPTVLVAASAGVLRSRLVDSLRRNDYLTLEAGSNVAVLDVIIRHSRSIQVLLLDTSLGNPEFTALLRRYRSNMHILLVASTPGHAGALPPDAALAKTRELLEPLKRKVAAAT
jgi:hypothetical protein